MKKIALLLTMVLIVGKVFSQNVTKQDSLLILSLGQKAVLSKTNLNFAIPDIPAFNVLGNTPSSILRPSTPKELALAFSQFLNSNNKIVIPQSFAAEITPGLFMHNYTLQQYQDSSGINMIRFLTKARVSIGTVKDSTTDASRLAGGLRFTLVDKGDFRNDQSFMKSIYKVLDQYQPLVTELKDQYIIQTGIARHDFDPNSEGFQKFLSDHHALPADLVDEAINDSIASYKKLHWNATRVDVAYAVSGSSTDTLLGNASVDMHSFWATSAFAINSKKGTIGQWLIGINDVYSRNAGDSAFYNKFNLSTRFYAGSNRIKGFIEGQYQNDQLSSDNYLTANCGLEVNPHDGIWIQFHAGIENALTAKTNKIVSQLQIFLTLPEKFNFN